MDVARKNFDNPTSMLGIRCVSKTLILHLIQKCTLEICTLRVKQI